MQCTGPKGRESRGRFRYKGTGQYSCVKRNTSMTMHLKMKLLSWSSPLQHMNPRFQRLRNRYHIGAAQRVSIGRWSSLGANRRTTTSESFKLKLHLGTGSCYSPCLKLLRVAYDNVSSKLQFKTSAVSAKLSGKSQKCFSSSPSINANRTSSHQCGVLSSVIEAYELAKQPTGPCEADNSQFDPVSESQNEQAEGSLGVDVAKLRAFLRLWDIGKSTQIDFSELLVVADYLERFGLDLYFRQEIKNILDRVFRIWTESSSLSETAALLGDLQNAALAFYLLRSHEYDVQPNIFQLYRKEDGKFYKRPQQAADQWDSGEPYNPSAGVADLLNLLRASDLKFRCDVGLKDAYHFASTTLRGLLDGEGGGPQLSENTADDVRYRLKYPWAINLRLLETRHTILTFQAESVTARFSSSDRLSFKVVSLMLSTATNLVNGYISLFEREIQALELWNKASGLEMVNIRSNMVILPAYLGMAYDMAQPKYAYTREVFAKVIYLVIVLDDLYDVGASADHLIVFKDAVARWDPSVLEKLPKDQGPMPIRVIFKEMYDLTNSWAKQSSVWYGRDLLQTFIRHWVVRLEVFMSERNWLETGYKLNLDEFVNEFARWSFSTETSTPLAYYSIPWGKVSSSFFETRPDMTAVFAISKTGRFFNDARSYKYEKFTESQGKREFVHLLMENQQLREKDAVEQAEQYAQVALEETTEAVLRCGIPHPGVKDVLLSHLKWSVLLYYFVDGLRNPDHVLSTLMERLPIPSLQHVQYR